MTDRQVLVIGGGGHCKVVVEVLRAAGWTPCGILDPRAASPFVLGVPVLGGDEMAPELFEQGQRHAFVALGLNRLRHQLCLKLRSIGFELVTAVHPSATISPSAAIGSGTVIMPHAVINAEARVGEFAIVNTGAIVEHDCAVGTAAHIAPRSVMGGNVKLGEEVLFGIGAVARPWSEVGSRTVVGAGSVVVGHVGAGLTVAGAPARPLADRMSAKGRA